MTWVIRMEMVKAPVGLLIQQVAAIQVISWVEAGGAFHKNPSRKTRRTNLLNKQETASTTFRR